MPSFSITMAAVSIAGSVAGGLMQKSAADSQAAQYKFNAQSEKIAGDQAEVARRSDLVSTLSAIDAVRTARGLDATSPTGMALAQNATTQAERGIGTDRLNYGTRAQSDLFAASAAESRGNASLLSGFLEGASSFNTYAENAGWFASHGG